MPAGPTSCGAEHMFPAGKYMQSMCIEHVYIHIHSWPHRSQMPSVHTNTDCTSVSSGSLLLLSSMEVRWQKYINICTHRYIYLHIFSVDASSSRARCGIWATEPPRQQPCSSGCTDHCVHTHITCTPMHIYTQLTSIPLVPPTNISFCSLAR